MRSGMWGVALASAFLASCTSFTPNPGEQQWRQIRWKADYEEARQAAEREEKPILVILVSGDLEAEC